jgi:hypothetical protein
MVPTTCSILCIRHTTLSCDLNETSPPLSLMTYRIYSTIFNPFLSKYSFILILYSLYNFLLSFRFPLTFYFNIKIYLTSHSHDFNRFTNFLYAISCLIVSHLLFKTFYLHFREQTTHLLLKMKQSQMEGWGGRPNEQNNLNIMRSWNVL